MFNLFTSQFATKKDHGKDNYSGHISVYFLPSKSEVGDTFKKYVAYMQNQFECNIRQFKSDRGTEYLNNEIQQFLDSKGIIQGTTSGYDSQANGICERFNRTLQSLVRANLLNDGLSNKFWHYAAKYE
ncbi:unnamed protein product [Ambrosiozyma monospora]|uniref:Unnamed protein product n=1 Tax=Ambrosiozyma monospora TaxID=43982 RepID=A0A9W7DMR5_AMBMO|nr:unnamed protein product [Ambrosiozyma monospora]